MTLFNMFDYLFIANLEKHSKVISVALKELQDKTCIKFTRMKIWHKHGIHFKFGSM